MVKPDRPSMPYYSITVIGYIAMRGCAWFRFYEELNDFLPPERHKLSFKHNFSSTASIKDMIESLGVPHTEVDLLLVNGKSVAFNYLVRDGDAISIYPVFESLDISAITRCRAKPLRHTRFVLDIQLGRLAAYCRMLGFDSLYRNDYDDPTLADIATNEQRILLTRDHKLLTRKQVTHGYYIRATQPRRQIAEILTRFDLYDCLQPFTRCMRCNGGIKIISKEKATAHVPPRVSAWHDEFWQCQDCGKIYWQGTHYQRMQQLIANLKNRQ